VFAGKKKMLEGISYLNNDYILIVFNLWRKEVLR
jgi:hypothetical protein